MKIEELNKIIIDNFTDQRGIVNINGLHFGNRKLRMNFIQAETISMNCAVADTIIQCGHVAREIEQNEHTCEKVMQVRHRALNVLEGQHIAETVEYGRNIAIKNIKHNNNRAYSNEDIIAMVKQV